VAVLTVALPNEDAEAGFRKRHGCGARHAGGRFFGHHHRGHRGHHGWHGRANCCGTAAPVYNCHGSGYSACHGASPAYTTGCHGSSATYSEPAYDHQQDYPADDRQVSPSDVPQDYGVPQQASSSDVAPQQGASDVGRQQVAPSDTDAPTTDTSSPATPAVDAASDVPPPPPVEPPADLPVDES
jgi:hypothetical protein